MVSDYSLSLAHGMVLSQAVALAGTTLPPFYSLWDDDFPLWIDADGWGHGHVAMTGQGEWL